MLIINYNFGKFSEVNHLNKNFNPKRNKIKITIDIISAPEIYKAIYPIVVRQFEKLFPNIKRHHCCNGKIANGIRHKLKEENYALNILHLVEHVIIDLQCSLSNLRMCSGITCNYYEPPNRYDIFVECVDKNIAFSSAGKTIEFILQLLNNNRYYGSNNSLVIGQKLAAGSDVFKKLTLQQMDYGDFVTKDLLNPLEILKN